MVVDVSYPSQRKPDFPQAYSVQCVQNVQSNFEPIWRPRLAWMSELSINTMKVCEELTLASDWPTLITWPQHWPLIGQYSPLQGYTALSCHVTWELEAGDRESSPAPVSQPPPCPRTDRGYLDTSEGPHTWPRPQARVASASVRSEYVLWQSVQFVQFAWLNSNL